MKPDRRTLAVAYLTFTALGLTSGLLGLAWPSMRSQFSLKLDAISAIFFASTAAYTVSSLPIGRIMRRIGTAQTLLLGTVLLMAAMVGLAIANTWPRVVCCFALGGIASGFIDGGLNLYLARHYSPSQMIRLHAAFGIGATLGPLIMNAVLYLQLSWHYGYLAAALLLTIPIVGLFITRSDWQNDLINQSLSDEPHPSIPFIHSLKLPNIWLGIGLFIACVGLELSVAQWLYTLMTTHRHFQPEVAGFLVSAHWASFTSGRIFFALFAYRFNTDRLLKSLLLFMIVGSVLFWWNPLHIIGITGLMVFAFAEAPVFPLLMNGTRARVGFAHTDNAVGLQMMSANISSAACPALIGTLSQRFGIGLMAPCFVLLSLIAFTLNRFSQPPERQPTNPLE